MAAKSASLGRRGTLCAGRRGSTPVPPFKNAFINSGTPKPKHCSDHSPSLHGAVSNCRGRSGLPAVSCQLYTCFRPSAIMLARARPRALSSARLQCLQQKKPRQQFLNKNRTLTRDSFGQQSASNTPVGGGRARWQQEAGGGGGGWRQSGSSRRFARAFRQVVPLPWLAVACFSAVDLASNAYVVETEDFRRLMQRCNFHITAAEVGDAADLESLYDLTDWVYESIDAAGPTALPKLLDADVIGIALRGAGSPDPDISTLCHEMLNVLSSNEHVAAMMAKDPSVRAVLVDEVRRQLSGWKTTASGEDNDTVPFAPEQIHDVASAEGDDVTSASPLRHARYRRRLTGHVSGISMGVEGRHRLEAGSAGGEAEEDLDYGSDGDSEAREVDGAAREDPPGTIVLDPFYAALTLRTLNNVMRASRAGTKTPESSTDLFSSTIISDSERRLKIPWPVRLLYGGNDYGEAESDGAAGEVSEWPLELKLVGDIAELMLSVSVRGDQGVRVVPQEGEGELDEVGQMDARHALQGLEAAAASVLRETSSHPQLVDLLMRRRPLFALVTLSWKGQSVKAEDWAAEATLNVCAAYRRLYSVPEPVDKMASHNVVSVLTSWSKRLLAEEKAGIEAVELGPGHEDRAFVLQAERAIPPLALSDPLLTITASAVVGLSGIAWGTIRRWVAWRRAGETFAAISRFALPRALLWAGLRAGLGATALTATHGPFGFRSQMRYRTLDATSGNRGTLTMSGVRELADLGYLYLILRLCPYSLLPAFVLNSMLKGGPVAGDAWTG